MRDDKLAQPGYQPKGSMCAGCESSDANCSSLPFHTMPVIGEYWGVKIVRCTQYKPATTEKFDKWRGFATTRQRVREQTERIKELEASLATNQATKDFDLNRWLNWQDEKERWLADLSEAQRMGLGSATEAHRLEAENEHLRRILAAVETKETSFGDPHHFKDMDGMPGITTRQGADMSTFEIKNRWTGAVQFTCELDASLEDESLEVRLGAAVKMAFGRGASLCGANLRGADLYDTNLYGADLRDANLRSADLYGANLRGASLCGAILRGAILRDADLCDADLCDADLYGADLRDANLYDANLRGADLRGADLRGAILCDANLYGADLYGADLRDADLCDASYGEGVPLTREPIFISGLRFPIYIFDEHIKIGCELHRISRWESYGDREIIEMDGREGAREWRAHKAWLLELARKHQSLCAYDYADAMLAARTQESKQ